MQSIDAQLATKYRSLDPAAAEFVRHCLQPKEQRPAIEQVLQHPFLATL